MSIVVYIAVMALVTYLIRMIPFTLFRKKIKSKFFKSFDLYVSEKRHRVQSEFIHIEFDTSMRIASD